MPARRLVLDIAGAPPHTDDIVDPEATATELRSAHPESGVDQEAVPDALEFAAGERAMRDARKDRHRGAGEQDQDVRRFAQDNLISMREARDLMTASGMGRAARRL